MITGTIVSNGKLRLILVGDDPIDKEALKALDGASVTLVKDNLKVFDKTVSDGLVLEVAPKEQKK